MQHFVGVALGWSCAKLKHRKYLFPNSHRNRQKYHFLCWYSYEVGVRDCGSFWLLWQSPVTRVDRPRGQHTHTHTGVSRRPKSSQHRSVPTKEQCGCVLGKHAMPILGLGRRPSTLTWNLASSTPLAHGVNKPTLHNLLRLLNVNIVSKIAFEAIWSQTYQYSPTQPWCEHSHLQSGPPQVDFIYKMNDEWLFVPRSSCYVRMPKKLIGGF